MFSESKKGAEIQIKMLKEISKEYGLKINEEKSKILIFNNKNPPEKIENIKVYKTMKYLGVTVNNNCKDCYKDHKSELIKKAEKFAKMTYSITAKSCSKIIIGKAFWECIAIPSILHGAQAINFSETDIQKLQNIENKVHRSLIGAPIYTPLCVLRKEIGVKTIRTRIMQQKLEFYNFIYNSEKTELIKKVVDDMKYTKMIYTWINDVDKIAGKLNKSLQDFKGYSKDSIKKSLEEWENNEMINQIKEMKSLQIYRDNFEKINSNSSHLYDNSFGSTLLFEARTNSLPLEEKINKKNKKCKVCQIEEENLEHFLIKCPAYNTIRNQYKIFTDSKLESKDIIRKLLFIDDKDMTEIINRKNLLRKMWEERTNKMKYLK